MPPGLHILLVEDHLDTAQLTARILQAEGHRVELATTIAEAKRRCWGEPFDLLIADLQLPDGFAWELRERLTACHAIPAIVVSAHGRPEQIERSRQAGFSQHLVKPWTLEQLRQAVGQATQG